MKLTRGKRIVLELLGPPALGALLYVMVFAGLALWEIVVNAKPIWKTLYEGGVISLAVLMFAYLLTGVQSIAYTVMMEGWFKRGLNPTSWETVRRSSGLGFLSGGAIGVVSYVSGAENGAVKIGLIFGGLGLIVGFVLGLIIKLSARDT